MRAKCAVTQCFIQSWLVIRTMSWRINQAQADALLVGLGCFQHLCIRLTSTPIFRKVPW